MVNRRVNICCSSVPVFLDFGVTVSRLNPFTEVAMTFARLKSLLSSFLRREDGNLTIILTLAAVPLVGIAGLAIDGENY